jgi:undecaprenyl-diphosphatase
VNARLSSSVAAFAASHANLAYSMVFLLALSESIPIVGAVVPGSAVIIAISTLAPSGAVRVWPLLGAATAGAIVGDGLSFWIGRRYHREILTRWPLNRFPQLVARSEAFFSRHGDKSVFLARFTPGVRAFIPLLAGALQMPAPRFYAANTLSALAWAPSHILPGVLVGASIGLLGAAGKTLALLLVILLAASWVVTATVRFAFHRVVPLLSTAAERLRPWVGVGDRWSGPVLLSLLDPSRSDGRALAMLAFTLAGAAWLFLGILEDVVSGDPLVRVDTWIYRVLQDLRTPSLLARGDSGRFSAQHDYQGRAPP